MIIKKNFKRRNKNLEKPEQTLALTILLFISGELKEENCLQLGDSRRYRTLQSFPLHS
jgi:hypothetical protein